MNPAGGFARVWRGVFGHPAFLNEAEEAAFCWMIAKASWQPTRLNFKGKRLHLKRGQLAISQRDFAAGFGWSKGALYRFLERGKTEAVFGAESGAGVTVITICNYEQYQATTDGPGAPTGASSGAQAGRKRGTEQRKERKEEDSPLPPKGAGRTKLPANWKPPAITELPPKAQEAARQWPAEAYEREAEGFVLYWTSEGKMKADWRATWANRIINCHWRIMQEARRAGGADEPRPLWETRRAERLAKEGRA